MATLVENAIRIKQTFDDIYDAIAEQGVTPSGGVDTYAEAIDQINTQNFGFSSLGNSVLTLSQGSINVNTSYFSKSSGNCTSLLDCSLLCSFFLVTLSSSTTTNRTGIRVLKNGQLEYEIHMAANESYPVLGYYKLDLKRGDVITFGYDNVSVLLSYEAKFYTYTE